MASNPNIKKAIKMNGHRDPPSNRGAAITRAYKFNEISDIINEFVRLHDEDELVLNPAVVDFDLDNNNLLNTGYIDFCLDCIPPQQEGRLHWDDENGTLELGLKGGVVKLQIGQEQNLRCKNNTGSIITNGSVVYITGASGANPTIALADADSLLTSFVLGVATEDIDSQGYVTTMGVVNEIDTSSFTAGDIIWLSQTPGEMTNVRPDSPATSVFLGYILRESATEGSIVIRPTVVARLQGLSDVYVDGQVPVDKETVHYNDTTNRFDIRTTQTNDILGSGTNDVVWRDINVGGALLQLAVANNPGKVQFKDNTGTGTGIWTYGFAPTELVSGSFELQHDYKEGSDFYFHIHWQGITAPAGGTDNVQWQVIYTVTRHGQTLSPITTITAESAITTQYAFTTTGFTASSGTGYKIGDQVLFQLQRIAASSDEYAGEALIATFGIHYQVDTIGSLQITSKT